MKFEDLFPQFNRPEYPKNPEAFQSALAWSLVDSASSIDATCISDDVDPDKPIGLIYKKISSRARNISLVETRPQSSRMDRLSTSLADAGFIPEETIGIDFVSDSLLTALEGVKPEKAKGIAAAPITRAAAYLQNPVGVHTKANPPNFARIIEQIYGAGRRSQETQDSAAVAWHSAITSENDNLFGAVIESGLSEFLAKSGLTVSLLREEELAELAVKQPGWLAEAATPLHWFNRTWRTFCTPQWRKALAGRRWSDWASCILRTGISMAFLWESRFYRDLGKLLLSDEMHVGSAKQQLLKNTRPILDWHQEDLALTVRDENSGIKSSINDGYAIRTLLQSDSDILDRAANACPDQEEWGSSDGFDACIRAIHGVLTDADKDRISDCFRHTSSGAKNTIETVQYSLGIRQETGKHADFYGLLSRRSRRFLVVHPGEEWIVVIASMCAGAPGGRTILRSVRKSIAELGVGVSREVLIAELERAGLTTSSHDADDAIEVWAGF